MQSELEFDSRQTSRLVEEIFRMNRFCAISVPTLLIAAGVLLNADDSGRTTPVVVTASNTAANQLLVYNTGGQLLQTIPTQGQGGVAGNAGGIAANDGMIAVVNFGSKSVSVFARDGNGFKVKQVIPTVSSPVSVAFGHDHLYVLGTTNVESHGIFGARAADAPDGVAGLLVADGSSAQVGVLDSQLVISEKSNVIETVALRADGAVTGIAAPVQNIPSNVNAPFGLVTRGDNAYVTIAHADEIVLVRNSDVLTVTPSGTQHAPCWLALDGPFLYSSNSPSKSVSRYAVYGQKIVQDAAVAAQFGGNPTDIASGQGLIAVVDGAGSVSHLSIFNTDEDGNLTLNGVATINAPANGVAVLSGDN
jgi:hypothetical protein